MFSCRTSRSTYRPPSYFCLRAGSPQHCSRRHASKHAWHLSSSSVFSAASAAQRTIAAGECRAGATRGEDPARASRTRRRRRLGTAEAKRPKLKACVLRCLPRKMELSAHLEQYGGRCGSSTPTRTHPMRPPSSSSPGHLLYSSSPGLGKSRLRREQPFEEPNTPPRSPAAAKGGPSPGASDDDPMRCFHDGSYLAPLVPMVLAKDAEIRRQAICALANLTDEQARLSPSPRPSPRPRPRPSP